MRDIIHPDDQAGYEAAIADSFQTVTPFRYEWRIITRTGETKWLQGRLQPPRPRQDDTIWHGIILDITHQKQMEARLQTSLHQLEQLATIDSLTQVANRRRFDTYLQQVSAQLQRTPGWLSLIMIDIDYFKLYNDHYGHLQGDRCLQQVAQLLANSVQRATDLVARYGGEEFAIVLPETNSHGACLIGRQIQAHLATLAIPHAASPIRPVVTCSLGISSYQPGTPINTLHLLEAADAALYAAKQQGRDRWIHITLPS